MTPRRCQATNNRGAPCRAHPVSEGDFCFQHSPEHAEAAAAARRLGGLRRRREGAVAGAYELPGLSAPADLERLLEIVVSDTLELENSVPRNKTLISIVQTAARLIETRELAERISAMEEVVLRRGRRSRYRKIV